jgi:uncharacterized protein DUF6883
MKLPSADRVQIDDRKIREHLLSRTHAVGRFKARFFAAIGFDGTTARFGRKYTVPGELRGPAGVAQVLTVWIQETGQQGVRLVTVRPRWP